jgi:hypothetical protein
MKMLSFNAVPILLILLAGFLAYSNKPGWGWVVGAAVVLAVFPTSSESKEEETDSNEPS